MSNAFFCLERPLAPRLIQYLYCIALVVIAVMAVAGVVRGVRIMARPAPPPISAAAPNAAPQPGAVQPGPGMGPRMGMRGRRFGGPGMGPGMGPRRMRGPMMLRGMPPAVQGGAFLVLVLLRALIAWMVVRILAEMGATILKLRPATG